MVTRVDVRRLPGLTPTWVPIVSIALAFTSLIAAMGWALFRQLFWGMHIKLEIVWGNLHFVAMASALLGVLVFLIPMSLAKGEREVSPRDRTAAMCLAMTILYLVWLFAFGPFDLQVWR